MLYKNKSFKFYRVDSFGKCCLFGRRNKNEKNIIRALKLSIFNEIDDTINLKNLTFLTNISDIISILKADFTIKGKKPLTIIAIKGTSNWLDFFIDVEMFISSALFSIARQFPILYKSESYLSNNTSMPVTLIFINYMFSLIIYYMFYTLIYLEMVTVDSYWVGYFGTLAIQIVICIPLAIADKKLIK